MNDFLQNCIGIAIIMIAFCCLLSVIFNSLSEKRKQENEYKYRRSEPPLPKPRNK